MKAEMKTGRKHFKNHLGIKLQERKGKRKQKKLKNKKHEYFQGSSSKASSDRNIKEVKGIKSILKKGGLSFQSQKIKKRKGKNYGGFPKDCKKTGGFTLSSSNSDRMNRLQEFVNQEVGKMDKSSNITSAQSKQPLENNEKCNLIKDKKKLHNIQKDLLKDTEEINRLAKSLGLHSRQSKKVAPLFAEDFSDILADIDEGSLKRSKKYMDDNLNRKDILHDSESESDSDSETDSQYSDHVAAKNESYKGRIGSGSSMKKRNRTEENSEEDGTDNDFGSEIFAGKGNSRQNLIDSEVEEGSDDDESLVDFENYEKSDDSEIDGENGIDSGTGEDYEADEEYDDSQDLMYGEADSDVEAVEDYNIQELSDDEVEECSKEENDVEAIEEYDNKHELMDYEAEECSEEESDDRELIHDDTKEYELAFEGGSSYSSKPEVLKNGMVNEIDLYSSCSDDDTDLDGFIVNDDEEVEYDSGESELPDELELSPPNKEKRRRVLCIDDDDIYDSGNEFKPKSTGIRVDNVALDNDNSSSCSSPAKHKKKGHLVSSDDESPDIKRKNKIKNLVVLSDSECESLHPLSPPKTKKQHRVISDFDDIEEAEGQLKGNSEADVEMEGEVKADYDVVRKDVLSKKSKKKLKRKKKAKKDVNFRVDDEAVNGEIHVEAISNTSGVKLEEEMNYNTNINVLSMQVLSKKSKKKINKKKLAKEDVSLQVDDGAVNGAIQVKAISKTNRKPEEENENLNGSIDMEVQGLSIKSPRRLGVKNSKSNKVTGKELCVRNLQSEADVREDIYGRMKDKEGNILANKDQTSDKKYIPPALRKLMAMNVDEKKKELLSRLKRNINGLLNRLAESNMASIASQIEGLYGKHSHNEMNECLSQLFFDSIVSSSLTPERLVQEHAMLLAVLSANVGSQVGAYILTDFVTKWYEDMQENISGIEIQCKRYDNMLLLIANLFNFKVVNSRLIYDILQRLADVFTEKEVELILLILRTVGFSLRKDDPLALKTFITQIQSQAANYRSKGNQHYTRICFLLEIIHSIKNNNPSKVPNYDPSHVEYLKKVMKGLIHKDNNLSPLYVTLDDILKSKSQGRWWIVGSAWSGGLKEVTMPSDMEVVTKKKDVSMEEEFSEQFRKRAAKLQLTRPPRINIMYVITEGSEDYIDAFDKLLRLKLPTNQEQEIFNVILLCCQKGKIYNEFFSYLASRVCKFSKRYKRLLQFAVWDRFTGLENCKFREVRNLAKFLVHLIIDDGLSITVLKNLSFINADAQMIKFVKLILKDLLLHPTASDRVIQIFGKISSQSELQFFCQSLKIFISKFIVSEKKKDHPKHQMLYSRSQDVLHLLSMRVGVAM